MAAPDGTELRARAFLRAHQARPFGHDTPRGPMTAPPPPPEEPRWWETGPVDEQPTAPVPPADQGSGTPGVHVHIVPPTPPAPVDQAAADRRRRARRWVAIHGAAAGVGWTFGLYDAISLGLQTTGDGGVPMGLALAGLSYVGADFALSRYGRFVPQRLRPAAAWVLHIPFATALLATALYAPNALT